MTDFSLQFLHNEADEDEGLGHAGIETFKDAPYASTARECGQNSSDARLKEPVIINFDLLDVPVSDLVAHEQFRAAIDSCLQKSTKGGEEKDVEFFEQAKRIIDQDTIKVLSIADYNTRGLTGPCKPGQPFHSLVKATGVSSKEEETSGGSFGIGKNAVFAISDLQTVFYSTIYLDEDDTEQFLAQGKSILVSHDDGEGVSRRSTGYWGAPGYEPIDDDSVVPDWMCRDEAGTSIFAIGFRESPGWHHRMAASLIRNFFVAIHRGEMEFSLNGGDVQIKASTLAQLFQDQQIIDAAEDGSQLEDFVYASHLYDCLTSEETKKKILKVSGLGKVLVQTLIRDGLPKRLSIIRNGMIITDTLEKFGDKFAAFRMYRDFVAFVEPLENKGSALIKRLENPKHDGLSAERIPDEDKRKVATGNMRELAKKIRAAIREETLSVPDEVQALDELARFFADVDETDDIPDPDSDEDPENYVYTPNVRRPKRAPLPSIRGLEFPPEPPPDLPDTPPNPPSPPTPPKPERARGRHVALEDSRNRLGDEGKSGERTVWFTPTETAPVTLFVLASGMNSSDEVKVAASQIGKLVKGRIELDVIEGDRQRIDLTLAEDYAGPIELIALTYAGEEPSNAN